MQIHWSSKVPGVSLVIRCVFVVTVILFVAGLFVYGYRFGDIYAQIDVNYPEAGTINADKHLYWWDDTRSLGELHSLYFPNTIRYVYDLVLAQFIQDPVFRNFLQLFVLNLLYFISTFLALKSFFILFGNKSDPKTSSVFAWLLAIAAILNLSFIQTNAHPLFIQRFDYIIFCITVWLINKYVIGRSLGSLFALLFVGIVSNGTWQTFPFWLPFLAFLFIYNVYLVHTKRISLMNMIVAWTFYVLLILPSLVSIFYFQTNMQAEESTAMEYTSYVVNVANRNSTLPNVLSFIGGVNWDNTYSWDKNTYVYPYYWDFTYTSPYVYGRFIIVLMALLSIVVIKRMKFTYYVLPLVVGCIVMIASYNPPLGTIWQYFFDHVFIFKLFRESHNKFYPLLVFLLLLVTYLAVLVSTKIRKYIFILLVLHIAIFSIFVEKYTLYSNYAFFKLPVEYWGLEKVITDKEARVLVLPEFSTHHGYDFGSFGESPIPYIIPNPVVEISTTLESKINQSYVNTVLDNFNIQKSYSVYAKGSMDPTFDTSILSNANIGYVIIDTHIVGYPLVSESERQAMLQAMDSSTLYHIVAHEGGLYIYKRNAPNVPRVSGASVTYKQISPVLYEVYVQNVTSPTDIVLDQSYHPGWTLYLNTSKTNLGCPSFTNEMLITSCELGKDSTLTSEFGILYDTQLPISVEQTINHTNMWRVDPALLAHLLPSNYYSQNSNGGINLALTLYFRPQMYLDMSILVALLSACAASVFILWKPKMH